MAHTVIGSTIVVDGEISGDEDLVILGTVKGRISLRENIQVESDGVVEANIETATITVNGSVTGDIHESYSAVKVNAPIEDARFTRVTSGDGGGVAPSAARGAEVTPAAGAPGTPASSATSDKRPPSGP